MPHLSPEQQAIVTQALAGHNVLYTGPAGVGKSTVATAIIQAFNRRKQKYETVAPTGQAAERIGARTIHSLMFKDLGDRPVCEYVTMWTGRDESNPRKKKKAQWAMRKWLALRTIIIDELSMVGQQLFEKMDLVLRGIYDKPDTPFGGLQIIACGDFYQLPPVKDEYCFASPVFQQTFPAMHELTTVYRQRGDQTFLDALHEMRVGTLSPATYQLLESRVGLKPPLTVPAMRIYPTNDKVGQYNYYKYQALPGPEKLYAHSWLPCVSDPDWLNDVQLKSMLKHGPFESILKVKIGSVVRYTHNNRAIQKVNGSMGIIVKFAPHEDAPDGPAYPVVRFADGAVHCITPIAVKSSNKKCKMTQIPLKLAWAGTVHRLQGAQVDCAVIDLGPGIFEYGQAYTAASRVTSLAGLFLEDLDHDSIMPHPDVIAFMARFPRA